jgi:hypothetical protein
MGVGGQRHAAAALPPWKTRNQLYRRLGGPQGRSGRVRKILPLPGFEPRTVQPVTIRYTDWATGPTAIGINQLKSREIYKSTKMNDVMWTEPTAPRPFHCCCQRRQMWRCHELCNVHSFVKKTARRQTNPVENIFANKKTLNWLTATCQGNKAEILRLQLKRNVLEL